jgi:hypothetical protein
VIQYFPLALSAVAEVSAHGAEKYTWKGWQTVPDGINRYGDALARHLVKENLGMQDEDSGMLHAAHAAWNALARLELIMRDIPPNVRDQPGRPSEDRQAPNPSDPPSAASPCWADDQGGTK